MKILVTGASGFVGSYLLPELYRQGHSVVGTVLEHELESAKSKFGSENIFSLDICDRPQVEELIRREKPEAIIHLAGISFVPEAEKDYWRTLAVNVAGTGNLLRSLDAYTRDNAIEARFLFVSSGDVYGAVRSEDLPISEELKPTPGNFYAVSKLQAEALVELTARRSQYVRALIFRSFNHIGPGQGDQFVVSNFAKQLAEISLGLKPAVLSVGNLEAKRDFCDVRDVVSAYILGLDKGEGIVNICSGRAVAIQEIVNKLLQRCQTDVEIRPDPERMRPSDTPELRGSYDRALSLLGWKPTHTLDDSLEAIFKDWKQQLSVKCGS